MRSKHVKNRMEADRVEDLSKNWGSKIEGYSQTSISLVGLMNSE